MGLVAIALLSSLSVADVRIPFVSAPPPVAPAAAAPRSPTLVDAVHDVMATQRECARVLVLPVEDSDEARRQEIERALVRALRDRRREDVVTPIQVRAMVAEGGGEAAAKGVVADHILRAVVVPQGGVVSLRLSLTVVETAEVVGIRGVELGGSALERGASPSTVRGAVALALDQIGEAMETRGQPLRTQRLAVLVTAADGPAKDARLDTFLDAELASGLSERGFLVVERSRLAAVLQELGHGQLLEEEGAPQVGKVLGAQALVLARVAEAGPAFLLTARVVDAGSGRVLGASSVAFPRDGVVGLAAVETRTPVEAAFRSALAPGWGQAYNNQSAKSVAFAVGGYGGALCTVALGAWTGMSYRAYEEAAPLAGEDDTATGERVSGMLAQANTLLAGTVVLGGLTAGIWALGIGDALADALAEGSELAAR